MKGNHQQSQIQLGWQINDNHTLNNIKHAIKPNKLITWLTKEKIYLEADNLRIGKTKMIGYLTKMIGYLTKMIGYLTHIHPHLVNCNNIKTQIHNILKMIHISNKEAAQIGPKNKVDSNEMTDSSDEPTIHCPTFEVFQTTIDIRPANVQVEIDIMGIKCQTGKAALLREFFLRNIETLEQNGRGNFVPTGLANVIVMKNIIHNNNHYLRTMTSILIHRLLATALKIKILLDKVCMTIYDYLSDTEWFHGLEPTDIDGKYYLITTKHQMSEACKWLNDNLEDMFIEYIPK